MSVQVIDAPTAGKRVKVETVYSNLSDMAERLEIIIQYHANLGYNFVGIIESKDGQGHVTSGYGWRTLLFTNSDNE